MNHQSQLAQGEFCQATEVIKRTNNFRCSRLSLWHGTPGYSFLWPWKRSWGIWAVDLSLKWMGKITVAWPQQNYQLQKKWNPPTRSGFGFFLGAWTLKLKKSRLVQGVDKIHQPKFGVATHQPYAKGHDPSNAHPRRTPTNSSGARNKKTLLRAQNQSNRTLRECRKIWVSSLCHG